MHRGFHSSRHRAQDSYMSDQTATDEDGKLLHTPTGSSERHEVPQLPKGAAMPMYQSPSVPSPVRQAQGDRLDSITPPATPSQRLLDSDPNAQYATYPSENRRTDWAGTPEVKVTDTEPATKPWIPYPLRPWFWIPFFVLLVLLAIGLEIALHFSNKNNGWAAHGDFTDGASLLHYVYTLPPSFFAMILVALWAWTDIEIKKMQPYVDLVHGDSPPHRSLLLDYTRNNNFIVWTRAAANKHYLVALTTLMVLLTLSFQPLAAALLVVKNTWYQMPDVTVHNLAHVGLNQNSNFQDLTSFLTAAGFASADVQYDLPNPPFVLGQYTVAPFELPTNVEINSTVLFVNTTAMKSDSGCQSAPVTQAAQGDGSWNNSISVQGCSLSWIVNHTAEIVFGATATNCASGTLPQFSPVAFWFFQYTPSVKASATVCFPSFHLFDVAITYDLAAKNVTSVTELQPFSSSSNFSSAAGNVTGGTLNGRAYNGIEFNLTNPDQFVQERKSAIQLQMPAAVLEKATLSDAGVDGSFNSNSFVPLSTAVYTTYLTLLAQTVYFIPSNELNTIQIKTVVQRVFLSDVSVHLLAAGMLILVFFGTIIQLFHRYDRRNLRLRHEPGTIASAVSIGGQTGMGELLAGRQQQKDIDEVLSNRKFRIDPQTMKIIMEGEDGYEYATSPSNRRKSVFAALQGQHWGDKRFSRAPGGGSPLKTPNV